MRSLLILSLVFVTLSASAQNYSSSDPDYIQNVEKGLSALTSEKYDSCLYYYAQAFEIKQTSVLSTLRAATCAYSNRDEQMLDTYLDRAFKLDWSAAKSIFEFGEEFEYLRESGLHDQIKQRYIRAAEAEGINIELMEELEEIGESDQKYRRQMRTVADEYGWQSPQMDSLWALQNPIDSMNTLRIMQIINTYGYPGRSLVGPRQSGTAFLVIQHADQDVQEKYLSTITDAADAGEVRWSSVALLVDRVRLGRGEKQIYGSQVSRNDEENYFYFSPIENPHKVDSIRASVGLPPIQDYADRWEITWDPEKHIERSQKMENQ